MTEPTSSEDAASKQTLRYSSFVPQWARKGDLANEPELYWHGQAPDDTEDNHMTEPTLLPCPFAKCGGKAIMRSKYDTIWALCKHWVTCCSCGTASPGRYYKAPEEAIAVWNTRTSTPPAWQPIATAPKDGTVIDLWCSHGRIPCCSWRVAGNFNGDSAWHNESGFPIEYGHPKKIPTYWMPLPEPPKP